MLIFNIYLYYSTILKFYLKYKIYLANLRQLKDAKLKGLTAGSQLQIDAAGNFVFLGILVKVLF